MTTDTFVDAWLPSLPSEEVRVGLFVIRLEGIARPRKMTYAEMGMHCGVATELVHPALLSLAERGVIEYQKRRLRLVVGETTITLQMVNEKDELADLVQETRDLRLQLADAGNSSSGLDQKLHAEQANVIRIAEETLGRGVTHQEAFYLGDLITSFNPQRVAKAIELSHAQKNPLRAAYARLKRGSQGKAAEKKDSAVETITYQEYTG